jgi:hypothetical protein
MKPQPTRQRRQAHKQRKALARALHTAHQSSRQYRKMPLLARLSGRVRVSRPLRPHAELIIRALLGA